MAVRTDAAYREWKQKLATSMWNSMNQQNAAANAMNERNQNRALGSADTLGQTNYGLAPPTITADRNALLTAQRRFGDAQADFTETSALIGQDREAGLAQAAALGRSGRAMQDRTAALGAVDRLDQAAQEIGSREGTERDRAQMMREIAEFKAQAAGLGEGTILRSLDQQLAREQAGNAAALQTAIQVAAARGVQMDEWKLSQIAGTLNAASQERLAGTEQALRMQDLQLRQQARSLAMGQMADVLASTRSQELQAGGLELQGRTAATAARQGVLDQTRQDELARESAGAGLAAETRNATRTAQQNLDQVREQLRLGRDTASLEFLDRALAMGRTETRANSQTRLSRDQFAAGLVNQILQGTSTKTMDPGTMASIIQMLAG